VDFTFSLPQDTPKDRERLKELEQKITQHLGEYIYADDETSLEQCVLGLLKARGQRLALAEVGSGGSLTAALSGADADGQILAGAFVAPTVETLYNLLKIDYDNPADESADQRIKRLALVVAKATESQWSVVVGDVRRDQNGSGYVEVAFELPDGRLESRQVQISGSGELARARLSTQLLDQLRRGLR
jgi:nicotinamide-nucleotide amidase